MELSKARAKRSTFTAHSPQTTDPQPTVNAPRNAKALLAATAGCRSRHYDTPFGVTPCPAKKEVRNTAVCRYLIAGTIKTRQRVSNLDGACLRFLGPMSRWMISLKGDGAEPTLGLESLLADACTSWISSCWLVSANSVANQSLFCCRCYL